MIARRSLSTKARVALFEAKHHSATPSEMQRFMEKAIPEPNTGCWLWTAAATKSGYGHMLFRGRYVKAHRVSFMLHCGEISPGMHVCHSCDQPSCVNPDHLWLGTAKQNIADCISKKRFRRGRVGRPVLTKEQVADIRCRPRHYGSRIYLAKEFGVSVSTIYKALRGETWSE